MTVRRGRKPDPRQGVEPEPMGYGYEDLDVPVGYWAGRWTEFKRLLRLSWDESSAKGTLALSAGLIIVGFIMGVVDKFS